MYYELTDHFEVSADIDRCWRFFGSAENLPLITPPWLNFRIAMPTPLPPITQDAVLDYTIRWMGVAVKWRTRIIDWSPPRQFVVEATGPVAAVRSGVRHEDAQQLELIGHRSQSVAGR